MNHATSFLLSAVVLASIVNLANAQSGYLVTERGADYKVLQKTTVENGTNHVHRYVELASGMNYTNAYGQLVEAQEQITILPTGGAAATQGRHQVYFPGDIYNGVLEVVTPDGQHLRSRPLGITYDDGSNTVFIATLKHAVGYLVSSNKVVYRDAFTDFTADLVCTYRRGGFESDVVFRQQPPAPGDYGLDADFSTLQMVTEFFDTQDPQQIPAASDEWYGLQDNTLKFGKLTMAEGQAFAVNTADTNAPAADATSPTPVYKHWLRLDDRTFLIEEVPVEYLADDLSGLPLTAKNDPKGKAKTLFASHNHAFPPGHEFIADTNQILLASAGFKPEPGVVLDYNEVDTDQTDFTFASDTTYYISGDAGLSGTTTFEPGAVLKFAPGVTLGIATLWGNVSCQATAEKPLILTAKDDDAVGEVVSGSSGNPSGYYASTALNWTTYVYNINLAHVQVKWAQTGLFLRAYNSRAVTLDDIQISHCYWGICEVSTARTTYLKNLLLQSAYLGIQVDGTSFLIQNVTFSDLTYAMSRLSGNVNLKNCILANVWMQLPSWAAGNCNGFYNSQDFDNDGQSFTSQTYPFQTGAAGNAYLTTASGFRDVGTTTINSSLLAELHATTTYAPQDGSFSDTNAPDLGYHYPILTPPTANDDPSEYLCPNALHDIYLNNYASDPYNYPLTYVVLASPMHGTLSYQGSGHFIYTPNSCWEGTDSFTYKVNDGFQDSATATVTLTTGDTVYTYCTTTAQTCKNIPLSIGLAWYDSCGNDASTFTYTMLASPTNGTLTGTAPNLTYTPANAAFTGQDSFTYKVSTACGDSTTNNVAIAVVEDTVVANAASVQTCRATPVNISLTGSDNCNETLIWTLLNRPQHGTLNVTNGTLPEDVTYLPGDANYTGTDTFTYQARNEYGDLGVNTVTIMVGDQNITANSQTVLTGTNQPVNIALTASSPQGCTNAFSYTVAAGPTNGTLTGAGANLVYTPNLNYEGMDSFSFFAGDGVWSNAPATVTIYVVAGPTNLTAKCVSNGPGVVVNWSLDDVVRQMKNENGLVINGFEIYRRNAPGVFTTNDVIHTNFGSDQTNYLDMTVIPGMTYYYAVTFDYHDPNTGKTYTSPYSNVATNIACMPPSFGTNGVDVAFIIDNTGSMDESILAIQEGINNTLDYIVASSGGNYRLALVTPDNDQVNVRVSFGTTNRVVFENAVNILPDLGSPVGNYTPESTDECLNSIVNAFVASGRTNVIDCSRPGNDPTTLQINNFTLGFRTNAVKLVVLITDAPPSGFCDSGAYPYDTSYEVYAHQYALEAATNHIKVNAILVSGASFENDARTVLQDYSATTCGWYPPELDYYSTSSDVEADILYMLYNLGACGSP